MLPPASMLKAPGLPPVVEGLLLMVVPPSGSEYVWQVQGAFHAKRRESGTISEKRIIRGLPAGTSPHCGTARKVGECAWSVAIKRKLRANPSGTENAYKLAVELVSSAREVVIWHLAPQTLSALR